MFIERPRDYEWRNIYIMTGEAIITIFPAGFVRSLILRLFPGIKNAMNFYSDQYCFHDHYLSLLFTSSQSRGPKQHWCFDDCNWSAFVTKLKTKKDTDWQLCDYVWKPQAWNQQTVPIIPMRSFGYWNELTNANACSMREHPVFVAFVSPADSLNYIFLLNRSLK